MSDIENPKTVQAGSSFVTMFKRDGVVPNCDTFAGRLSLAMIDSNMRPSELARALDVTRAAVVNWTNGKTKSMSGDDAFKAAELLDINPAWLVLGRGPMRYDISALAEMFRHSINEGLSLEQSIKNMLHEFADLKSQSANKAINRISSPGGKASHVMDHLAELCKLIDETPGDQKGEITESAIAFLKIFGKKE